MLDIVVNGSKANVFIDGNFMMIPRAYLRLGVNQITIRYVNVFSNDGYGCVSYIDMTETPSKFYVYTHMEPHSAHKVFPCFDQPDLRGRMSLCMVTPMGWSAVANGKINY